MRLLLVEDSARLTETLSEGLSRSGHAVDTARTIALARDALAQHDFELIILDRWLPDGDGLDLLDSLRAQGSTVHILVLTARDTINDRVDGLRRGADDYLIKPFAFEELLARLDTIYRRAQRSPSPRLSLGPLTIDTASRTVTNDQSSVELTPREYSLLEYLAFRAREVVTRRDLEKHLYNAESAPSSNAVDRLVCSIRAKLQAAGAPSLIKTRRGAGYILAEDDL